jgi:GNAT superfamily N-acetyltransferase
MALVRSRLPGFEPTETIFATPDAFTGPGTAWLVGYEDGRAVCCGGLRPLLEPGVAEIKRMFVSEAARGRGHGRALVAGVEEWARERRAPRVVLWVLPENTAARTLYESSGYVDTGERREEDGSMLLARELL